VELGASSEFLDLASARAPLHRHAPSEKETRRSRACGSASRGVSVPRTQLRRVPCSSADPPFGSPWGTRVAKPSSVPSSGFLPLSTVPANSRLARDLAIPPFAMRPRRLAAFFHAARVPGTSLQSFPFPRSRTRSRGPFLPCGFAFDCRRRSACRSFTTAFARFAPALCPCRARPKADPGRMSRDEGFSRSLVRSPRHARRRTARTVPFPQRLGSPVSGRHARFEALLPPGVRSGRFPSLARPRPPAVALLGFLPSRAFSTTVRDSVYRVVARREPKLLSTRAAEHPAVAVAFRDPDTDAWIREPRIRRHAESIGLHAPPSSGDPAHERPRAPHAPATSPVFTLAGV